LDDETKKTTANQPGQGHIRPKEKAQAQARQHQSLFQSLREEPEQLDLTALKKRLEQNDEISKDRLDAAFGHVTQNLSYLGLDQPSPSLVVQWIAEILRQQGIRAEVLAQEMDKFSLHNVEKNIKSPLGSPSRGMQNPETTSHQIARQVKSQFACRKVYGADVVDAHESGDLSLIHLGDVDRPHDVFLTPDYIKLHGLPASKNSPESGPPKHANVLLAQMVRLTRELQRNFAGDIQWGFVNTLLLPFTQELSDTDLNQFIQQMIFEFAQIDPTPSQGGQRVILDMDLDMPRYFESIAAVGRAGRVETQSLGEFTAQLFRFNEALLEILGSGDFKTSPFHAPRLVFHLNRAQDPWSQLHQKLFEIAIRFGNPGISMSFLDRDFGPLGRLPLNDPDLMKLLSQPSLLRGFSTNSVALNLPRLFLAGPKAEFPDRLKRHLELCLNAHRQKRMFISKLMASGPQGPLRLLRHRNQGQPFMKLEQATQPIQLIGLGEAALLATGSPSSPADARAMQARTIAQNVRHHIDLLNKHHKLRLRLSDTQDESVSYRLASLDLRNFGQTHSTYILHRLDQTEPIYTSGTNILAFQNVNWRKRFALEGPLHDVFDGSFELALFSRGDPLSEATICQRLYREAAKARIRTLRFAPDLKLCRECHLVFHDTQTRSTCPNCSSSTTAQYGYCVSDFSPVDTWCRGMRTAWKLRHRWDEPTDQDQTQLPI